MWKTCLSIQTEWSKWEYNHHEWISVNEIIWYPMYTLNV